MKSILLTVWVLFGIAIAKADEPRPIVLRDLPLLFADDSGVADKSGVVRTVHVARTRPQPVLEGTLPTEGSRVYLAGTVHRDEKTGLLRMWYAGHPDLPDGAKPKVDGFRSGKGNFVLFATSKDGVTWDRPALGLHAFQGSKVNNIIYDFHSPSVFVDEADPDPARRYKMLGSLRGAYYSATSPDGLRWTGPKEPFLKTQDNITLTRDPVTGDYLAYLRKWPAIIRDLPRRTVWLSRSKDFDTWSKPELVFAPDEQDDAWVTDPNQRTEVNNMSVFPHAAGFLGFPTIFRVTATDRPAAELGHGQSGTDGTLDVQLITSADGRAWQRTEKREPIIPRGLAGRFDGGSIFGVCSTAVHTDEETWVYYTGINTSHGAPMPPKRISIGRAEWRRHGFVSLDAAQAGRVQTKPLSVQGGSLIINADASAGELRVALLEADGKPIEGYGFEQSEVLRANATAWRVGWQGRSTLPNDRPFALVIEMANARLYSLASGPQMSEKNSGKP